MSTRWLPKNPLQPFAWAAVFDLVFDCLMWLVLHRFGPVTVLRILSAIAFLWLYKRGSRFAWHVTFVALIVIQVCYGLGEFWQIITPPRLPSGRYAIFYPYIASLIAFSYLWFVRDWYFGRAHNDI